MGGIVTTIFCMRKRLSNKELEKMGKIIEDEIHRRDLIDEDKLLLKAKRGDYVNKTT